MTPAADRRLALGSILVIVAVVAFGVGYRIGEPSTPGTTSVDVGFLQDMIDHHDQAVVMSSYVMREGSGANPAVVNVGFEVIMEQRFEIGMMLAWLRDWGFETGDRDRRAMGWMDMAPTSVADMPGMQSTSKMKALEDARGSVADDDFLSMMIDHHRGGVHMGEYAMRHAGEAKVRALAKRIVTVQRSEIRELQALQKRLGLPVS